MVGICLTSATTTYRIVSVGALLLCMEKVVPVCSASMFQAEASTMAGITPLLFASSRPATGCAMTEARGCDEALAAQIAVVGKGPGANPITCMGLEVSAAQS